MEIFLKNTYYARNRQLLTRKFGFTIVFHGHFYTRTIFKLTLWFLKVKCESKIGKHLNGFN